MPSKFGEAIAERREFVGYPNQTDLVAALDKLLSGAFGLQKFSQQWLSRIERDRTGEIISSAHAPRIRALAHVLQWSMADLQKATGVNLGVTIPTGWEVIHDPADDIRSSSRVLIPVFALAAAGDGDWTEDDVLTYIEVEPDIANRKNRVTFQVNGMSMEPTLEDGDFIHVDMADQTIRDDKVYVVLVLTNGVVVKRARIYDDMSEHLTSDNPKYPPVRPDEARIIGRVFAVTPRTRKL